MESSHPLTQSWESLSSCPSNECSEGEEDWTNAVSPQARASGDAHSQNLSDSWCEVDSEVAAADASATGDEFSLVDEGDDAHSATTLSWSVVDGQEEVVSLSTTPITTPRATEVAPQRTAHPRLPQHVIFGHVYGVPAMSHLTQPSFPPANVNIVPKAARHLPTRAQVPSQTVSSAMLRRTGHLCQPKGRYRPGHKQCKVAPRQRGPN